MKSNTSIDKKKKLIFTLFNSFNRIESNIEILKKRFTFLMLS